MRAVNAALPPQYHEKHRPPGAASPVEGVWGERLSPHVIEMVQLDYIFDVVASLIPQEPPSLIGLSIYTFIKQGFSLTMFISV